MITFYVKNLTLKFYICIISDFFLALTKFAAATLSAAKRLKFEVLHVAYFSMSFFYYFSSLIVTKTRFLC